MGRAASRLEPEPIRFPSTSLEEHPTTIKLPFSSRAASKRPPAALRACSVSSSYIASSSSPVCLSTIIPHHPHRSSVPCPSGKGEASTPCLRAPFRTIAILKNCSTPTRRTGKLFLKIAIKEEKVCPFGSAVAIFKCVPYNESMKNGWALCTPGAHTPAGDRAERNGTHEGKNQAGRHWSGLLGNLPA